MKILRRKPRAQISSKGPGYPVPVMQRMEPEVLKLFLPMIDETRREIKRSGIASMDSAMSDIAAIIDRIYNKYMPGIAMQAQAIANRFLSDINRYSVKSLESTLKDFSIKFTDSSPAVDRKIGDLSAEFVAMIKRVGERHHDRVLKAVSIGSGAAGIFEELMNIEGVTRSIAKNIAEDQTRKMTSTINAVRLQEAGVTKFRWLHSSGGKTQRPLHVEADGQIYSYNDPPHIGDDGGPTLPGLEPNCRCRAIPELTF